MLSRVDACRPPYVGGYERDYEIEEMAFPGDNRFLVQNSRFDGSICMLQPYLMRSDWMHRLEDQKRQNEQIIFVNSSNQTMIR
jgi:hypothetical protein